MSAIIESSSWFSASPSMLRGSEEFNLKHSILMSTNNDKLLTTEMKSFAKRHHRGGGRRSKGYQFDDSFDDDDILFADTSFSSASTAQESDVSDYGPDDDDDDDNDDNGAAPLPRHNMDDSCLARVVEDEDENSFNTDMDRTSVNNNALLRRNCSHRRVTFSPDLIQVYVFHEWVPIAKDGENKDETFSMSSDETEGEELKRFPKRKKRRWARVLAKGLRWRNQRSIYDT